MTRDRFDQLTTHLHFAHLEEGAPLLEDRMWKLRPVVDALNDSFRTIFVSGQDITVDESLWKFRGRLAFRTYNPTKRARFGLKVYKLSTSTGPAAGYTSFFKVYTGQDRGDMPSSTKAVFHLMEYGGFLDKGYQLFVDSWTSVRRGDVDYRSSRTGLLALLWKDNANVVLLSTVHNAAMDGEKPMVVNDYNDGMKGVDIGDQMASYYPTTRRSKVWYRKIFFNLFDMAIVNAWTLHRALGGRGSLKTFKSVLSKELVGEFRRGAGSSRNRTAARPPAADQRFLRQWQHWVSELPDGKRRRCRWCSRQGRRRSTHSFCEGCNVALCINGCFKAWHVE
ncbi:piggyBac transposable element-derived protein 4 [Penaeus vannamei]|uniref:piggyBac transposable element-derived protein 4 n=1 Tax=Penaeus vannamei TaxID=6689 RepID=UPI00387F61A1